ncbi:dihydroxyacetone kinase subunit L [Paenibacillus cremeus]|uniref:dihydroxyacetone kinase subunit L n=1 Tax=Paenibacillus cremeus TaxID=2163881 RepID=UPI0021BD8559|nr:dihydroxyacetone kinase subunit L [Paenibacillus cremeus]
MSSGFAAVKDNFPNIPEGDIGALLMRSGLIMAEKAPSTMGTLMATALMRSGKAVQGKSELYLEDLIVVAKAMVSGIMERGKAKIGDKTILESLVPAAESLESSYSAGKSLVDAIHSAAEAAEEGMKQTIHMQSRLGRAGRYLEKSIGHQDAGATVGALFLKAFSNYMNQHRDVGERS